MPAKTFVKVAHQVSAIQWTGDNLEELKRFFAGTKWALGVSDSFSAGMVNSPILLLSSDHFATIHKAYKNNYIYVDSTGLVILDEITMKRSFLTAEQLSKLAEQLEES